MTLFGNDNAIFDFYSINIRQGMFTGFLTLASFLFAMKTFIVINMKTHLYDTVEFRNEIRKKRQKKSGIMIYGPLKRLNCLLLTTIALAITSSTLHFSLGLVHSDAAAIICLSVSAATIIALIVSVIQIGLNTRSLITTWEIDGNKKLSAHK